MYVCVYILTIELETPHFFTITPNIYNTLSPKSFILGYFRTLLTSQFCLNQNCSAVLLFR